MGHQQMTKRITVGVDGSPAARVAVDWAAREALLRGAHLRLVHVRPVVHWGAGPSTSQILSDAQRVVAEASEGHSLVVTQESIEGDIVDTLLDISRESGLVVTGSRGLGRAARAVLGSVSSALVNHAHCPVAVIHDEDPLMPRPGRAPVVVGVDGSPASDSAVEIAFAEAALREVPLVAVHAWHPMAGAFHNDAASDGHQQAEQLLADQLAAWQVHYPGLDVRRVVANDAPAHQLLLHSEAAQLLVVGSHGRGGFAGMTLGSVSGAVAQSARMPVIVARH